MTVIALLASQHQTCEIRSGMPLLIFPAPLHLGSVSRRLQDVVEKVEMLRRGRPAKVVTIGGEVRGLSVQ